MTRDAHLPQTFRSMVELQAWLDRFGPGRAVHLVVLHDDACPGPRTACTCRPEFVLEDLTVESVQRGAREERAWLNRHARN